MTTAIAKRFQIHLSDILLMACMPPIAAAYASKSSLRLPPLDAYLWSIGLMAPGTVVGVLLVNQWKVAGARRLLAMVGSMFTSLFFVGISVILYQTHTRSISRGCCAAAASCKAYAEAQEIYRRTDYDGDGVLEYAQTLRGTNSLLERVSGAGDLALIDKTFANAEGPPGCVPPKYGYVFKVLTAQGPAATGGARNYISNGNMTLGYALVACPGVYDVTGRDTFMISNNGTIFQKDLGPDTPKIVWAMTEFNPDTTWAAAE
jgi:hypothetical protein